MNPNIKAKVKEVVKGSIAYEAEIVAGDIISEINGVKITDILEYKFNVSDQELELKVIKENKEIEIIDIYNEDYEDLGIVFKNPLIDQSKACANKCMFCFIDQLPKKMRKTLYFKDDDWRLSFLQGNYVTLTNMTDEDINKIIKYHVSPINVSVHTTNTDLRIKMLSNKNAGKIMEQLKMLADAHITMNCQIVLCREINDGIELDKTLKDLSTLYPYINSISVVPVGLTKYRENLFNLLPFNKQQASKVINQIKCWQNKFIQAYSSRIVFAADEFYIMGSIDIPAHDCYEDFPQIENGVGLTSLMKQQFKDRIQSIEYGTSINRKTISIATGMLAKDFINWMINILRKKVSGLDVNVYPIENIFFGNKVTVAGLITGRDIINQLKNKIIGNELLIPITMLKDDENLFLDDISINDIEKELNIKVIVVKNDGYDFVDKVLGL